jgi:nitrite reductase (NADH) small subunit
MRVDIGAEADLREGEAKIVKVRGRELAAVLWRGEVHVIRNSCPHQSQSFENGRVSDVVCGGNPVGSLQVRDEPVIACSWHTWAFRLRDGMCVADPRFRVRRYDVVVEDGRILVDV